jgi:hypothetical protein
MHRSLVANVVKQVDVESVVEHVDGEAGAPLEVEEVASEKTEARRQSSRGSFMAR